MSEERFMNVRMEKRNQQALQFCKNFWHGSPHKEVQSNKFLHIYMIRCAVQVDYEADL